MAISKNYRPIYTENDTAYVFSTSTFSNLISEKYREYRSSKYPLTKEQIREKIADITCKSPEAVKKWGRGDNGPSDIQVVKDIAKYFEIDFHALLAPVEHSNIKKVPCIYADDEKSIIIQFYSLLADFIYDCIGNSDTCYLVKHQGENISTEDKSEYIYDIYRQLDKVAFNISENTYSKLHRIITECKTLCGLGWSPVPYLHLWIDINKRWLSLNPKLRVLAQYYQMEDYYDAKDNFTKKELNLLVKPFHEEAGYVEFKNNGKTYREEFEFFESYQFVPMELTRTLKLVFQNEFPELLKSDT